MNVQFPRHARRRMRLYKISEKVIISIFENAPLTSGKHTLIQEIPGQKLPAKIVAVVENSTITIVTAYPLKKGLPS